MFIACAHMGYIISISSLRKLMERGFEKLAGGHKLGSDWNWDSNSGSLDSEHCSVSVHHPASGEWGAVEIGRASSRSDVFSSGRQWAKQFLLHLSRANQLCQSVAQPLGRIFIWESVNGPVNNRTVKFKCSPFLNFQNGITFWVHILILGVKGFAIS